MSEMTPQESAEYLRHVADIFVTPAIKQAALMGVVALESSIPRVLTLEEVRIHKHPFIFIEQTAPKRAEWVNTTYVVNNYAHPDAVPSRKYGITWRCWSLESTPSQSNAVPWEPNKKENKT